MYRVELKGACPEVLEAEANCVPNVPCGVESGTWRNKSSLTYIRVPNVPCGVESKDGLAFDKFADLFLMYRVELKAGWQCVIRWARCECS